MENNNLRIRNWQIIPDPDPQLCQQSSVIDRLALPVMAWKPSAERQGSTQSRQAEEIRIPVPYGHIAGKAWGDPDGKPILGS